MMDKTKLKELAGKLTALANELDEIVHNDEVLEMYVAHDGSVEVVSGFTRDAFRCYFSAHEVEVEVIGEKSVKALATLLSAKIREE